MAAAFTKQVTTFVVILLCLLPCLAEEGSGALDEDEPYTTLFDMKVNSVDDGLDENELDSEIPLTNEDIPGHPLDGDTIEKESSEEPSGDATITLSIVPEGTSAKTTFLDAASVNVNDSVTPLNISDPQLAVNITEKAHRRITCTGRNLTENDTQAVTLVNNTQLLQRLTVKNESLSICAVVMFYAPWCVFCAKSAPHYNALARAFPQLDVMAIDAIKYSSLNARFGSIAVPNILVFHNSKAVARFNNTVRTYETMVEFISNVTSLEPNISVVVEAQDYEGPLPSTPTQETDYLLMLSWAFLIIFTSSMFTRSATGQKVVQFLASFGQEHHHQHID